MASFNALVSNVVQQSDIVLVVVDARNIEESIHKDIEAKLIGMKKPFLYVINKCDLLTKQEQKQITLQNAVQISATKHLGTMRLLRKIMELAKGLHVTVGIVGYPNTGKSTIINALKGRHSAPTSPISGFTRSLSKVRINRKIIIIDTPGVFDHKPLSPSENIALVALGTVDPARLKDPEHTVMQLIETMNGRIEKYYGVKKSNDPLETLEAIALKKHMLLKKGLPDTIRMSKEIITQCQKGTIR